MRQCVDLRSDVTVRNLLLKNRLQNSNNTLFPESLSLMCELSITNVHPPDPGDEWYLTQDNICSSASERTVVAAEGVYFQPDIAVFNILVWLHTR